MKPIRSMSRRAAADVLGQGDRNLLQQVLEHVAIAVFILDRRGHFTLVNRAASEISGYAVDDLIGKHFSMCFRRTALPDAVTQFQRVIVGGETISNYPVEILRKDGARRIVNLSGAPFHDNGKVTNAICVAEDITAHAHAEEMLLASHDLLQTVVENAPVRVFWKDTELRYLGCNTAFARDAGLSRPEELLGKDDFQMGWREQAELYRADDRRVMEAGTPKLGYEEPQTTPDGRTIWLRTSKVPLRTADGKVFGMLGIYDDVTERKRAEDALRDSAAKLDRLLNSMAEGAYGMDIHGNCTFVNRAFLQKLGYQNADEVLGKPIHEIIHHTRADGSPYPANECRIDRAYHDRQPINVTDEVFWRKDGVAIPVEYWSYPIVTDGVVAGAIVTFVDITARKRQEALLAGEKHVLELLARDEPLPVALDALARTYEQQHDGHKRAVILLYDPDNVRLRLGSAPSLPEPLRRKFDGIEIDLADELHAACRESVAVSNIASDPRFAPIRSETRRHGWQRCWTLPILAAAGKILGVFAVFTVERNRPTAEDRELLERVGQLAAVAIEKIRAQEKLATIAYYDVLTGLPNRVLLIDRLRQAIFEADRHERLIALLFLDLDRFKNVNDTLGHEMGDLLLHNVGRRLQECVRPGDTVSRPGGDEFIIVLAGVAHVDDVSRVAQKIIGNFSRPFKIGGDALFVTCSIGIALYPFDDRNIETLYRNADAAMYQAKNEGGNNFQFYRAEMNAQSFKRLALENALRRALERDEFRLYYQPQVDVTTGRIVGAEALIRWQHPERGLLLPADFISLAEETGLIVPIGEWVLRQACAQARAWQSAGLAPLRVAVNLSPRQFRQKPLGDVIAAALQIAGLTPEWLEVEVTETLVMHDVNQTIEVLQGLERMGVSVAVDDFGTGCSSLNYLRRLPIDVIKIDRTFIEHITDKPDDAAIVSAIITLAKSLRLKAVAEGVETQEQLQFLQHYGCDIVQGYYVSRPLPADEFIGFLRRNTGMRP